MSRGKRTVLDALRSELTRRQGYLLAVSGGVDSMVLASAALEIAREHQLTLAVAHLDHGIRKESCEDAEFVAEMARVHGLPCYLKRVEPPETAENLEAWGRRERYSFFQFLLERERLSAVLTAHNANDVAETLLMRLVSNKELGTIQRYDPVRRCLRPLLAVTREEIESYARGNGVLFREDETNQDRSFLRNRVRAELLPRFEEFDPRAAEVLSQRALAIGSDIDALYELAHRTVAELGSFEWGGKEWLRALRNKVVGAPKAVSWRVVEVLVEKRTGVKVGRSHALRALDVVVSNSVGTELPGGIEVRRSDGRLLVSLTG